MDLVQIPNNSNSNNGNLQNLAEQSVAAAIVFASLSQLRGTPMQLAMAQRTILGTDAGKIFLASEKNKLHGEISMAKNMFQSDTKAVNAFDELHTSVNAIGS
jgi:hypothetical protein